MQVYTFLYWTRLNLLCFYFYPLRYGAVPLKVTYYAQYYNQEQELLSDYYAVHIQFCMNISLHVADSFIFYNDCFIRVY